MGVGRWELGVGRWELGAKSFSHKRRLFVLTDRAIIDRFSMIRSRLLTTTESRAIMINVVENTNAGVAQW